MIITGGTTAAAAGCAKTATAATTRDVEPTTRSRHAPAGSSVVLLVMIGQGAVRAIQGPAARNQIVDVDLELVRAARARQREDPDR
jgi:hypothetical protein